MQLQVAHLEGVAAAVLGEAAREVGDRVDELVCD
jgi:hypothetical protein